MIVRILAVACLVLSVVAAGLWVWNDILRERLKAAESANETSRAIDGVDTSADPLGWLCDSLGGLGGGLCRDGAEPDGARGGADDAADR
jgi:hypothetical protein